ncbi:MAG: hypothetical protein KME31_25485 [Tolypothrix carrinoi HA7290-LM1]|nr:hypothetical protein [Tolypothrix carrinoi HA7290-LM1]
MFCTSHTQEQLGLKPHRRNKCLQLVRCCTDPIDPYTHSATPNKSCSIPMPHAPCPMPHARCPIPYSQIKKVILADL